jgi:Ca2+-binding RTX toxin-like protein
MLRTLLVVSVAGLAAAIAVGVGGAATINCQTNVNCHGTNNADVMFGTDGHNWMDGNNGADDIHGFGGDDDLFGDYGADLLAGSTGADDIWGGHGPDTLYGQDGNDRLYAGCSGGCSQSGEGVDYLYGNDGRDVLAAENGKTDVLDGGAGTDICYRDNADTVRNCEEVH